MSAHERIMGILGDVDRVESEVFTGTDAKIAAILDLKDNPIVGVAGQFGTQQPSAALPQLTEALTQLALKQTQDELNKSTAINDPMAAENERLRRQVENLELQKKLQALQAPPPPPPGPQGPQGGPPPGPQGGGMPPAPAGGMPGGQPQMPQDMAGMYGAAPQPQQGMPPMGMDMGGDPMEQLRAALQG